MTLVSITNLDTGARRYTFSTPGGVYLTHNLTSKQIARGGSMIFLFARHASCWNVYAVRMDNEANRKWSAACIAGFVAEGSWQDGCKLTVALS